MPATSGASGPTIVRSMRSARASEIEPGDILGGDVDVADLVLGRRAGVAGRDEHLAHPWRGRAFPGERVLAAAGADDEDFHQ